LTVFLLYGVLLIAIIFAVFRFTIWYSSAMTHQIVERKHRDMEFISQTGVAPPRWSPRLLLQLGRRAMARSRALRRISTLIRYVRHSPLVDSEEARRELIAQLERVRLRWQDEDCETIYGQE